MSYKPVPLSRALSKIGCCSRAKAALYIQNGKVSVNGRIVKSPFLLVDLNKDVIRFEERLYSKPETVVIMLNKPRGFVTTSSDELGRRTVYELVPNDRHLFAIGRLDLDTTGLLLFTNNGELQNKITSPKNQICKTYHLAVGGKVTENQVAKLLRGVEIKDGVVCKADKCDVIEIEQFRTILEITIHEGKNRELRKMVEAIGKKVISLHRIAIGNLRLDVPIGKWRRLSNEEIKLIFS
jgi:23S rRNA pseudouridine2605 synthase